MFEQLNQATEAGCLNTEWSFIYILGIVELLVLFFSLIFPQEPTYVRSYQFYQKHTSVGFWLCPRVDGDNTHRQWHYISSHRQSLQWVILPLWHFSVIFGDSITFQLFFVCLNSQVHEAGQLWNYWNYKSRAYICLLNNWNSWQMTRVPIIRYMEAWLGNTMLILGCHGPVCPVASRHDWSVTHRSPSRQERAVITHTLTRLSLLQAFWLQ